MPKTVRTSCTAHPSCGLQNAPYRGNHRNVTIPCTMGGGARCRLLEHRREINAVLLGGAVELREDTQCERTGAASIRIMQASGCGLVCGDEHEDLRRQDALQLVQRLLNQHRCITSIELPWNCNCHDRLLRIMQRNRSLQSLTVYGGGVHPYEAAFMLHLFIRPPVLENQPSRGYGVRNQFDPYTTPVRVVPWHELDRLTTLDVTALALNRESACRLVQALIRNRSVIDLSVGEVVFSAGAHNSGELFVQYLVQKDSCLKKLTLREHGFYDRWSLLPTLIDAVCRMTSLEELDVTGLGTTCSRNNFPGTIALFADVFARSTTIRRLKLPQISKHTWLACCHVPEVPHDDSAKCMEPWLSALRKPNSTIGELRIDLRHFGEGECRAFLEAVAKNEALKLVSVHALPSVASLDNVCKTIRERGLSDRVIIERLRVCPTTTAIMQRCPEFSSATLVMGCFHRFVSVEPEEAVSSAFRVLGDCVHVTSLRVSCVLLGRTALSALAACIRNSTTLKSVEVDMVDLVHEATLEERRKAETEIMSALASNTNLTRIRVEGLLTLGEDLALFAGDARKSRRLTEFNLTPLCQYYGKEVLPTCLWHKAELQSWAPSKKMTLLADIQETTARNNSALRATARYVLCGEDVFEDARAIEFMHDHPRLLEIVRERAAVTNGEAKRMIARAHLRIRRCSLDEYMRLAGVVKQGVECYRHPGAGLQLPDIGEHCWLRIRSFLTIADVLESSAHVADHRTY